jgi:hypothetical protein
MESGMNYERMYFTMELSIPVDSTDDMDVALTKTEDALMTALEVAGCKDLEIVDGFATC